MHELQLILPSSGALLILLTLLAGILLVRRPVRRHCAFFQR